jgi:hypothetical protein
VREQSLRPSGRPSSWRLYSWQSGLLSGSWKRLTGHCRRAAPQTKGDTTDSLCASAVGVRATFKSSIPTNQGKKHQGQHDVELPFARMITDVTGMSPQRRRNSDTHVGYSGQTALTAWKVEYVDVAIARQQFGKQAPAARDTPQTRGRNIRASTTWSCHSRGWSQTSQTSPQIRRNGDTHVATLDKQP